MISRNHHHHRHRLRLGRIGVWLVFAVEHRSLLHGLRIRLALGECTGPIRCTTDRTNPPSLRLVGPSWVVPNTANGGPENNSRRRT